MQIAQPLESGSKRAHNRSARVHCHTGSGVCADLLKRPRRVAAVGVFCVLCSARLEPIARVHRTRSTALRSVHAAPRRALSAESRSRREQQPLTQARGECVNGTDRGVSEAFSLSLSLSLSPRASRCRCIRPHCVRCSLVARVMSQRERERAMD